MMRNLMITTVILVIVISGALLWKQINSQQDAPAQDVVTKTEGKTAPSTYKSSSMIPEDVKRQNIKPASLSGSAVNPDHADEEFSLSKALSERGLGNPDAPVRIEEFASLSCSHCANFHHTVFKELLDKEVNTGRVYLVYNDLPTSASAITAAQVARCVDEKHYFKIIGVLFKTQDDWAFDRDYENKIKQVASLLGMNDTEYNACIKNTDLRDGILKNVQTKTEGFDITSTPSFIINGKDVIQGGRSYEDFKTLIDKHANVAE